MVKMRPKESSVQEAFVSWFRLQWPTVLVYAIPNGAALGGNAKQRAIQMQRLKREGLVVGHPDLSIPAWRMVIEMKRDAKAKPTEDQLFWLDYYESIGWKSTLAHTLEEARTACLDRAAELKQPRRSN